MTHAKHRHARWPALPGALLALAAAALFGLSTPLVQQLGIGLGSFSTAGLLYAGATLAGWLQRQPRELEARLRPGDLPRLLAMACFGAALGPVALAWGLQQAPGSSASLMLTLEAVFTALLARWWYGEQLDRRVLAALALLTLGGMGLVLDQAQPVASAGAQALAGLLAVALATAAWGVDNSLSRPLSGRDPGQVVAAKGLLGALLTLGIAIALGEPRPAAWTALGLLAVGATGYGLSLRCYLLAQRGFGAARTASVFAFAPFIGAAAAWALGERISSPLFFGGAGLMAAGLLLHMAESHDHGHAHEALRHEHAHRHDDGHHDDHHHDPLPVGPHSHPHQHTARWHAHPHVPDEHHGHAH